MKRVFIVHGWRGYPEEGWFPWLRLELEKMGFEVHVPQLPDNKNPTIDSWVQALGQAVETADNQTYFIGHSLGCQTIIRYLEQLPQGVWVGGAVLVAGFFKRLVDLDDFVGPKFNLTEVEEQAKEWLNTPIDWVEVKSHLYLSVAIFSDNDPIVPLDNAPDIKSKLGSEVVILSGLGHLSGRDGVIELPEVVEAVKKLLHRV